MIGSSTSSEPFKTAKIATAAVLLYYMAKEKPITLAFGSFLGLTFPEESLKKTNRIWNTLFKPEAQNEELTWLESLTNKMPLITAATVGFFALPTVTYPALAFAFSVQLGANGFELTRVFELSEEIK
ncbi:MAG TPA: hypothetical protein PLC42_00370 [Parachlamydiaceae bacterium]|nr:hypothetical protein [Parachlamydiaceae bacterium]